MKHFIRKKQGLLILKNNKGFAISGILYATLMLFLILMLGTLSVLATSKFLLDKTKNDLVNRLNNEESYIEEPNIVEPSAPELSTGMIPIKWNGTSWIKADINNNEGANQWYDYDNKMWANVVLVTEATRTTYQNAALGTTINEADVLAYLVWIPRYKYKLFNVEALPVSTQTIEIEFEDKTTLKSNGNANGEWLTHSAFTFGTEEINGFWVGKFETTGDAVTPTIKPGIVSLRSQDAKTQFITSQKFNTTVTYGLTAINDSHMMKNLEWGAVIYLTQSQYGKNEEVWINPSSSYITGCAGTSASVVSSTGCSYLYTTTNGQQASTTGNIYGIYDMSGGAREKVMGAMYNNDNETIMILLSGFTQEEIDNETMNKYMDKYNYGDTYEDITAYSRRKLGDATGETRGWNGDYNYFIMSTNPWFNRGGNYTYEVTAGLFSFRYGNGSGISDSSFRVVILGE